MFLWSKKRQEAIDTEYERKIQKVRQPILDKMDEATASLAKVNRTMTKSKVRHITEAIAYATGGDRR